MTHAMRYSAPAAGSLTPRCRTHKFLRTLPAQRPGLEAGGMWSTGLEPGSISNIKRIGAICFLVRRPGDHWAERATAGIQGTNRSRNLHNRPIRKEAIQ
jgi:hypothetical protein